MSKLKSQLNTHIQSDNFDRFFDTFEYHISPDSDLVDLLMLLRNRYQRFKIDTIKRTLTEEQRSRQQNLLLQELLELVKMADDEDFKKEEIPLSIAYFHSTISTKQEEFANISNQKGGGLEKAGQVLMNLGALISAKKNELDPSIPFHDHLQSASEMADRKVRIACKEMREVREYQLTTIRELIEWYRSLISYLDLPKEEINDAKKDLLRNMFSDAKKYKSNLRKNHDKTVAALLESVQELDQLMVLETILLQALPLEQEEVKAQRDSIHSAFRSFDAIKQTYSDTYDYFKTNGLQIDQLIEEWHSIVVALELNIKV